MIAQFVSSSLLYLSVSYREPSDIFTLIIKWVDVVSNFNFNRGDYIEIKANLSNCTATNENIISVGDTIDEWNQYTGGYHSYYTRSSNSFEVNSLLPTGQEGR